MNISKIRVPAAEQEPRAQVMEKDPTVTGSMWNKMCLLQMSYGLSRAFKISGILKKMLLFRGKQC